MKKILIASFIMLTSIALMAQTNDNDQIKEVINKAYIEGIHNGGDLNETRKGFHPGFDLLMLQNNQLNKLPIYNWIESSERARKENLNAQRPKTTVNYVNIDITGTAAVAKIELLREGKLIFTDYLMLYKFEEGWKIVGKTYFRHP
ncbi:MAG: nuclear transport factor 2 family protein [Bacteroidales bacterium]|nr:MAG: nuclear transport factor 2 family protein [Bacteroidales bacterium]